MSGDFKIESPLIMEISSYFYHLPASLLTELFIMESASSPFADSARPDLTHSGSSSIYDWFAGVDMSSMVSDSLRSRWYKLAFLKGWKLP